MQVPAQAIQHASHFWTIALTAFASGGSVTAGAIKFGQYVAKALPSLPKDAGFWDTLAYNLVKNVSGIDPNTVSLKPYDGSVDRRAK